MNESEFRAHIESLLSLWNERTENSLRRLLAEPIVLEGSVPYVHFEIEDMEPYRIYEMNSEYEVDLVLERDHDVGEKAEFAGVDCDDVEHEVLVNWLADRWHAVDGPALYSPAFVQFHWGTGVYAFDLEERVWKTEYPPSN